MGVGSAVTPNFRVKLCCLPHKLPFSSIIVQLPFSIMPFLSAGIEYQGQQSEVLVECEKGPFLVLGGLQHVGQHCLT
jgi:hypothetical protein